MADETTPTTDATTKKFAGYRTYAMGAFIIIHQLLAANGIDVPEQLYSNIIDGVLGILVIYFRNKANK